MRGSDIGVHRELWEKAQNMNPRAECGCGHYVKDHWADFSRLVYSYYRRTTLRAAREDSCSRCDCYELHDAAEMEREYEDLLVRKLTEILVDERKSDERKFGVTGFTI